MQEGRPSATAQGAALLRAAHQLLDQPRVLDDPLALRVAGPEAEATLRADPAPFQTDERRHLRAFIAMRSRYAEDELAQAVRRGIRQYVVLGAGLDTFAYRNPPSNALRVFEVDHPQTQAWKQRRLREASIALPPCLTFAPVDFESETLAGALRAAGLRTDEPAFFSWLGVTVYLTHAAVMETLRYVASTPAAGSEIVFSFVPPHAGSRSGIGHRTASLGEPWVTFFDPAELERELRAMGFGRTEHVSPAYANRRYFADRADGLRVGGTGHLMKATV
jgi:methyltransferase (TIGR00027 family)